MRYLFSKNKASDINDAGEKLQKAIRMYHNKVLIPHDTLFLEDISFLVFNILFVMLMLLKIFTPGEKGVMFLVGVIGIAIIDGLFSFMVFGSNQPDYGYIGTSLNNKISRIIRVPNMFSTIFNNFFNIFWLQSFPFYFNYLFYSI